MSRKYAMSTMSKQFSEALKRADLKTDKSERQRTLYSLRHTAIMKRLINGAPIKAVADNAGTSVAMIDRFYGSHLTGEMDAARFIADDPMTVEETSVNLRRFFG